MKLEKMHVGKWIKFANSPIEYGIFLGRIACRSDDKTFDRVVLQRENGSITTSHVLGNTEMNSNGWHLMDAESILPASIEPLMKEFGCHEKQTRALVAAILKEAKEK